MIFKRGLEMIAPFQPDMELPVAVGSTDLLFYKEGIIRVKKGLEYTFPRSVKTMRITLGFEKGKYFIAIQVDWKPEMPVDVAEDTVVNTPTFEGDQH